MIFFYWIAPRRSTQEWFCMSVCTSVYAEKEAAHMFFIFHPFFT